MRMGTSFNSLGITRHSEISVLSEIEAAEREREVGRYLSRQEREHRGERITYRLFTH